ncbi:MAG: DUF4405 domain-containing protein [Dehalococcoidales bacterium]
MKLRSINFYNYTMDFLLLYGSLTLLFSNIVLWFVLPASTGLGGIYRCDYGYTGQGSVGNIEKVLSIGRFDWIEVHIWIAIILAIMVVVHILMHWDWSIESIKRVKNYTNTNKVAALERYVVNILMVVFSAFELLSGLVIWLILPRGLGYQNLVHIGAGPTFWNLQRDEWRNLHDWAAVALVALIIIHVIIHWDWITKITMGKFKGKKTKDATEKECPQVLLDIDDGINRTGYSKRAGFLLGLSGALSFIPLLLFFQIDQMARYGFMLYLIPLPLICFLVAQKWHRIGGALLTFAGVASLLIYYYFPVGTRWQAPGLWSSSFWGELTIALLVTIPLIISGIIYLLHGQETAQCEAEQKLST